MNVTLRIKMIGTTLVLLIFTVTLFAILQLRMSTADLEAETVRLRALQIEQAKQLGTRTVSSIAASSHFLIADNDFAALSKQIEPVVEGARQGDLHIRTAVITNTDGQVLAYAPADEEHPKPTLDVSTLGTLKDAEAVVGDVDEDGVPADVTVTASIVDRDGKVWGYTRFVYDLVGLRQALADIETRATERRSAVIERTTALGALFVLLGIVMAVLQSLAISKPILDLARSAKQIAEGDLSARATVKGRDEIATLSTRFNEMADRINLLLRETAQKTAMEKELEVARVIQETLLPPTGLVDVGYLRFAGYFRSASMCGGDFWTHFDLNEGRTFLGVGDVTGHGVPSAMITAACKSGLNTLRSVTGGNLRVSKMLEELNKTIHEAARRKFFMTFFGMIVDPDSQTVEFANAGHNFPLLVRMEEGKLKTRGLIARGNRLGDVKDGRFTARTEALLPGDLVCLYTDGITEYRNAAGEEFTERRLRRLLQGAWSVEPDVAIQLVMTDLKQFAGDAVQEDDITIVIAKIRG